MPHPVLVDSAISEPTESSSRASRRTSALLTALDLLAAAAVITATETVVFQLLGHADTDAFRDLAKLLK